MASLLALLQRFLSYNNAKMASLLALLQRFLSFNNAKMASLLDSGMVVVIFITGKANFRANMFFFRRFGHMPTDELSV
jgi:hypothetical protein